MCMYLYAIDCLMCFLYGTVYIFVYIYYIILCSLTICNAHYSSSDLSILVLQDLLLIWAVLMSSQRVKQPLSTDWSYVYIYIYILYIYILYIYIYICHWFFFQYSYPRCMAHFLFCWNFLADPQKCLLCYFSLIIHVITM